ncbi:MAG TPA: glycosyltransferase [Syntrophorhabdales bacterium]|nr:glycosyltransferase [Syntrophorhabdales bacterium]
MPEKDRTKRRLKVIIVAAAAHPEKGSEPGLGWGWIEALSKHHDLWVIAGEREGNREAIERRFIEFPDLRERVQIYFIPRPDGPRIEEIVPLLYYRTYRKWHQKAFALATELHKEIGFDLAHQLNMTGYREPGYLWRLDLPFVWGPVGGTANVPLRFASILGMQQFLYHAAKITVNELQLRFHGRVRQAISRCDGFVTSTTDGHDKFLRILGKDSIMMNDNGPPFTRPAFQPRNVNQSKVPLRLAWSGLHISRKALPIVLKALALLPSTIEWHIDILGHGAMTAKWKRMACNLRIGERCSWHGWVDKNKAIDIVSSADLFLFSSLHESTPAVIFEALSQGVPVICINHCGQGDVITEECGIKIPVTSCRQVIKDFAQAIHHLATNPEERNRLGEGALKRIGEFSWERKAEAMVEVYETATHHWNNKSARG